ncbi:response regulator transcription factor [Hymenobacter negativus]|uniref:Response regulator transcription factor n=1 Tax=Hymenobacter negativus TaxID=2795026 RepID=A0ABS3QG89_9BACT|nr:response regulator transcription factor [Hymenobacter negativus]MBO2009993.1 response regulator transcription factor [Hymenobacter negativus]
MIRVFLVDDHTVLRTGLHSLLADQPGLSVVGEASNGLELLEQLPNAPTDVVLLDINMPGMDGPETAQQLQEHYPEVQVLVLSMLAGTEYISRMLDAGAAGYLLKSAGLDEIVHGIRTVAAGRPFLCSEAGFAALHKLRSEMNEPINPEAKTTLSKRETEVLQLIAEGLTNGEIGDKLFTSKRTIETHRQNIIAKTQMKNTASLIRFAVSEGLVA